MILSISATVKLQIGATRDDNERVAAHGMGGELVSWRADR